MRRPRRYKKPTEKKKYYEPDPAEEFAETAVGSYFAMNWEEATFEVSKRKVSRNLKRNSLEWILSRQAFLEKHSKKTPILLFVVSTENRTIARKSKPTTQHLRSEKLETDIFEHTSLKMPICTRFFTCYRMDIASVSKEDWPELHSAKAPFVAIFSPEGKLLSTHKSGLSAVFAGMAKAAKLCKVDLPAVYRDADGQIRELYDNEVKLFRLKEDLKQVQAKVNGKRKVSPNRLRDLEKAQKLVKECEELNKKIKAKYETILTGHGRLATSTSSTAAETDHDSDSASEHDHDH